MLEVKAVVGFVGTAGAQHPRTEALTDQLLEITARTALIADERLGATQRDRQQPQRHLALLLVGRGEDGRARAGACSRTSASGSSISHSRMSASSERLEVSTERPHFDRRRVQQHDRIAAAPGLYETKTPQSPSIVSASRHRRLR